MFRSQSEVPLASFMQLAERVRFYPWLRALGCSQPLSFYERLFAVGFPNLRAFPSLSRPSSTPSFIVKIQRRGSCRAERKLRNSAQLVFVAAFQLSESRLRTHPTGTPHPHKHPNLDNCLFLNEGRPAPLYHRLVANL